MPIFALWPGKVKAGSQSEHVITHTDLFATVAAIAGAKIPKGAAADSYSFLPLLLGKAEAYSRPPVIHHSASGMFAIRDGDWKLVLGNAPAVANNHAGKPLRDHTFWRTLRHMAMSRKILLKPNRLSRNDLRKSFKKFTKTSVANSKA